MKRTLTLLFLLISLNVFAGGYTGPKGFTNAASSLSNFFGAPGMFFSTGFILDNYKSIGADGTDEYISRADNNLLDFTTQMSAFYWVKNDSGSGGNMTMFSKYNSSNNQRIWNMQRAATKTLLRVLLSDNGSSIRKAYDSSETVHDNTWHWAGFTFNAGTLKLYVDGVEDTNASKVTDAACASLHVGTSNVTVFAQSTTAPSNFVVGSMDDAVLWSSELGADEIIDIYREYKTGKAPDLKKNFGSYKSSSNVRLWYRMGDGPGDGNVTIYDQSGNALDGTVNNMETADIETEAPPN